MYYIVCGLPDLTIAEMTSLVKHAQGVLTTVMGFGGTDAITRRDALLIGRTLDASLGQLANKAGLASQAVDQAATCSAVTAAWKMSTEGPAAVFLATVMARAALEGMTERIASARQPIAVPGGSGGRDWAAAGVIAVASTAAAMALAAVAAFVWGRARKQLAPRRRR